MYIAMMIVLTFGKTCNLKAVLFTFWKIITVIYINLLYNVFQVIP